MAKVLFAGLRDAGRSPMALAFFERLADDRHRGTSAGSAPAERLQSEVVEAMSELGIELADHRPRQLTCGEIEAANLVVTMSCRQTPEVSARRCVDWDLTDPCGVSIDQIRVIRDELEARVEQLVAELDAAEDQDLARFEALVADAIDRLPSEFQALLESVAVVVSDLGSDVHAYGQYFGDGVARSRFEDRIVLYRDTLERDFGHDPKLLAQQVERTLRHELAHHLGWGERGVGGLGL
jgi:arsenate reductase (thioredoxin)